MINVNASVNGSTNAGAAVGMTYSLRQCLVPITGLFPMPMPVPVPGQLTVSELVSVLRVEASAG